MLGRPPVAREEKKKQMTLFLVPRTIDKLRKLAKENGMTLSAYCRFVLERRVSLSDETGD
jgi:hypothetical protein